MANTENSQPTRQQLYERIKASGRNAVILEEMQRLGFWKSEDGASAIPEMLIHKEADLIKELNKLLQQQRIYQNREEALKKVRQARLEQSRKKREENKILRKQKKEARAARWKELKEKNIIYLGEKVSKGLNNQISDSNKLSKYQLPVLQTAEELSEAMKLSIGELKFLSYNRTISKINHYRRFYIPKKTGGKRLISTPMPRLKKAQHWILENILNKIDPTESAHGFVKKRSIVSNALPHVKAEVVVNIDLKDFFPSINYRRVKGLFIALGYSEQISTIFALICTEPDCDQVELDGETYYAAGSDRFLPQGAPTSPAITNLICRKLDLRLKGIATKLHFNYTRYADDLTFSASGIATSNTSTLLGFVKKIIKDEKLHINPDKLRVQRKGARKEVTGIVVNDKPSVCRKDLDKFRALLHQIEKEGTIKGKHWNNSNNLLASIKGYANFVKMVNPEKGKPLAERVNKILEAHRFKHIIKHKPKKQSTTTNIVNSKSADQSKAENKKPWWKFW